MHPNIEVYTIKRATSAFETLLSFTVYFPGLLHKSTSKLFNVATNLSIEWYKPKEGHKYIYKNREHLYFPDFYLPKYNVFIEVKGYQRESDEYKWKVLNNLIVIKQDDINKILKKEYKLPFLD